MVMLFVDGRKVSVPETFTVIQACAAAGVEIPRFCYHERLSIAGNCRMCLVEIEGSKKPVAACAMPIRNDMVIRTNTSLVKKAREGVLELLLINHPLDCPICDQGGECDLQDQAMAFGSDRGRFNEYKRSVADKNFGPLIKTIMTRCIHCTRCVRFASEVAGVPVLGTTGRGKDTEIGTYISRIFDSELSGNIVDLCPVGALTSKPYAFIARPWELRSIESIDIFDGIGSNISVQIRGSDVMRILPRLNEEVNEEWISDKIRFSVDGLRRQRLRYPLLRKDGKLVSVSWEEALSVVGNRLSGASASSLGISFGGLTDMQTIFAAKLLGSHFGTSNFYHEKMIDQGSVDARTLFTMSSGIRSVEQADLVLLLSVNPRREGSVFNSRIRKAVVRNNAIVATVGVTGTLNYPTVSLGDDLSVLIQLAEGRHAFSKLLSRAKAPVIIYGDEFRTHINSVQLMDVLTQLSMRLSNTRAALYPLASDASFTGYCELGLNASPYRLPLNALSTLYAIGSDNLDWNLVSSNTFVIYQGHHGDRGASRADVVLPSLSFVEKNASYMNTEGRIQNTKVAVTLPGEGKVDWHILRVLSEFVGVDLPINDENTLSVLFQQEAASASIVDTRLPSIHASKLVSKYDVCVHSGRSDVVVDNYYLSNSILRSSSLMAKCASSFKWYLSDK